MCLLENCTTCPHLLPFFISSQITCCRHIYSVNKFFGGVYYDMQQPGFILRSDHVGSAMDIVELRQVLCASVSLANTHPTNSSTVMIIYHPGLV
jgi:hypothetical protein